VYSADLPEGLILMSTKMGASLSISRELRIYIRLQTVNRLQVLLKIRKFDQKLRILREKTTLIWGIEMGQTLLKETC